MTNSKIINNKSPWAIQGFVGSFHQEATRIFLGKEVQVLPCNSFRDLIKAAQNKKESSGAVMAIENSIAGSILPNYNLLHKSDLKIIGEVYMQIKQNLLVNKGVIHDDILEVQSHPMALQQCYGFLDKYNWKLTETEDTALSAKHIAQHHSKHIAAIASRTAAELYNLDILSPNIHTLKNNYTRFLILVRREDAIEINWANKASVYFTTNHAKGSLAKVLSLIADGDINLSKLQSMPIPGSDFNYGFYADMEFGNKEKFNIVIEQMKKVTEEIKVYGVYKNGKGNPSRIIGTKGRERRINQI